MPMRFISVWTIVLLIVSASLGTTDDEATIEPRNSGTDERMISEVLRLAVAIRQAEEAYEKLDRVCKTANDAQDTPEMYQEKRAACSQSMEARSRSEQARRQFHALLDRAQHERLPSDWLRAHFTWVRWSPEWQRSAVY